MTSFPSLLEILIIAIPVIVAITFHEAAHGFVAWRLGDNTAHAMGRVTFNPLRHVDFFGTILLPAILLLARAPFLFGWAKPVPIDASKLRHPRRDMVLVAAAGPGSNLVLALVSGVLLALYTSQYGSQDGQGDFAEKALSISVYINAILAVFNMLPLPPLDGGRVAVGLLPDKMAYALAGLERWGLFLVIGVLFLLPLVTAQLGHEINLFTWAILPIVDWIVDLVVALTGAALHSPWS